MSISVRLATEADLPAIEAIQATSPEAAHWNPADYLLEICYVADSGEPPGVAGFLVLRALGGGEHEILNLAVSPELRRRGVAQALIATLRLRPGTYFLEVRESNAAARAFYARQGFATGGRRRSYYRDPTEDAILMSATVNL